VRNDTILIEMMSEGAAIEEVLVEIGMSEAQHNELLETDETYRKTMEEGYLASYAWWLKYGRNMLNDRNFNNTIYAMVMKNRFGWTDAKKKDDSLIDDNPARKDENIKKFKIVR